MLRSSACKVCSSTSATRLVRRDNVPVLLNKLHPTAAAANAQRAGEIDMFRCEQCGFVWNNAFDPKIIDYSDGYENCQTHSAAFQMHLASCAERILQGIPGHAAATVVEIGCGQGDFLARLLAMAKPGQIARAVGFDPASRSDPQPGIEIYREYFTAQSMQSRNLAPDLVLSRHTIEHISEPVAFLRAIRSAIGERDARLIVETPDNSWILRHNVQQDIFYEHCSLFTMASLSRALEVSGFAPTNVGVCFEGQYLWAEAVASQDVDTLAFAAREPAYIEHWHSVLRGLVVDGPVLVWGAGAKGVTFCHLVDRQQLLLRGVVDSNPAKQGNYLSGTGHPIVAPGMLAQIAPAHILIMNPNYESEIRSTARQLGVDAEFHLVN